MPPRARPAWHPRRRPVGPAARPAAAGAPWARARAAARSPPGCRWTAAGPGSAPRSAARPRTAPPPGPGSARHRRRPRSAHANPSNTPAPGRHTPANRIRQSTSTPLSEVGRGGRLRSRGVEGGADTEFLLDLLLDLVGEVGVVAQEGADVLLALTELVALVGVPSA